LGEVKPYMCADNNFVRCRILPDTYSVYVCVTCAIWQGAWSRQLSTEYRTRGDWRIWLEIGRMVGPRRKQISPYYNQKTEGGE